MTWLSKWKAAIATFLGAVLIIFVAKARAKRPVTQETVLDIIADKSTQIKQDVERVKETTVEVVKHQQAAELAALPVERVDATDIQQAIKEWNK